MSGESNREKVKAKPLEYSLLLWLRGAFASLLLGRILQLSFGDFPLRALLWDESLWRRLIEITSSWERYLLLSEILFPYLLGSWAVTLLAAGIYALTKTNAYFTSSYLSASLLFFALIFWKEKQYEWAELGEYALQCFTPIAYYYYFNYKKLNKLIFTGLLASASLTFAAHGWYALGFSPRPGIFLDMTLFLLPFNETEAILFLKAVGALDLLAAFCIFLPDFRKTALKWMTLWGGITTFARWSLIAAAPSLWLGLAENIFEILVRIPHFLLPIFAWRYSSLQPRPTIIQGNKV
jgi:hypothetical protein